MASIVSTNNGCCRRLVVLEIAFMFSLKSRGLSSWGCFDIYAKCKHLIHIILGEACRKYKAGITRPIASKVQPVIAAFWGFAVSRPNFVIPQESLAVPIWAFNFALHLLYPPANHSDLFMVSNSKLCFAAPTLFLLRLYISSDWCLISPFWVVEKVQVYILKGDVMLWPSNKICRQCGSSRTKQTSGSTRLLALVHLFRTIYIQI